MVVQDLVKFNSVILVTFSFNSSPLKLSRRGGVISDNVIDQDPEFMSTSPPGAISEGVFILIYSHDNLLCNEKAVKSQMPFISNVCTEVLKTTFFNLPWLPHPQKFA